MLFAQKYKKKNDGGSLRALLTFYALSMFVVASAQDVRPPQWGLQDQNIQFPLDLERKVDSAKNHSDFDTSQLLDSAPRDPIPFPLHKLIPYLITTGTIYIQKNVLEAIKAQKKTPFLLPPQNFNSTEFPTFDCLTDALNRRIHPFISKVSSVLVLAIFFF
ncbi:unnamed protein product [Caenorhabditis auriculariae]|uniref:Uncharacterized protein n=1 Tax=Caenorhabditis auriculariae TaxID=2777116 RepID=A0A8S1HLZ1_9PELO|nr:unnamed protein product [Caenorhabditis auriculariae]